jgi:hypothetical protein
MILHKLAPAVLLAVCATGALAQAPLPGLRVEPATGSSILFVHNAAGQPPLTAFLVELVHYPGSYYQLWDDDITTQPIAPDAEKRISISNMTVGAVPNYVKLTAAIYADGTTAGVPEKISELVARRKFLLETTRELIVRVDKPGAATDLKQWADSLPALTRATQNVQEAINQSAAKTLVAETAAQMDKHSVADVLTALRASEAALIASKPAL